MGAGAADGRLLVDGSGDIYLGDHGALGSVGGDDALIEFATPSIDGEVHNREAILHFKAAGDKAERIDPIALGPRDFVDEWLKRPWGETAKWSSRESLTKLENRYRGLHKLAEYLLGRYLGPSQRCTRRPGVWQVGLAAGGLGTEQDFEKGWRETYFLVSWEPPYRFRMVAAADKPWSDCKIDDEQADERRTLFNVQDWR